MAYSPQASSSSRDALLDSLLDSGSTSYDTPAPPARLYKRSSSLALTDSNGPSRRQSILGLSGYMNHDKGTTETEHLLTPVLERPQHKNKHKEVRIQDRYYEHKLRSHKNLGSVP